MQKCIYEKANLNCAKEIAKTEESSKAAIQHFTGRDKGTAEIHQFRHQCHKVPTPKSAYKHKCKQHQAHRGSPFKKHKLWNPRSEGGPSHYSGHACSKCGDSKHWPGFYCSAQKFKCQNCHKTGHFTRWCFHRGKQDKYHKTNQKMSMALPLKMVKMTATPCQWKVTKNPLPAMKFLCRNYNSR